MRFPATIWMSEPDHSVGTMGMSTAFDRDGPPRQEGGSLLYHFIHHE